MTSASTQRVDHCNRCGHDQPHGMDCCMLCGMPMYARPTGWHPRTWWSWTRWFLLHKVLHVDDTPHRIALGLAVGMFIAFLPLVGFQMAVTVLVAWIVRANKVVGVPLAWISNPVTMGPMYYFNYRVGGLFLGPGHATLAHFQRLAHFRTGQGWWADTVDYVRYSGGLLMEVFWRCWLGSLIVAVILGVATYFAGYWFVVSYRARHRKLFPHSRFDSKGHMVAGDLPPPGE